MSRRRKTDWSAERGRRLRQKLGMDSGALCHYCPNVADTMDHIIPYSYIMNLRDLKIDVGVGWRASVENLTPACYQCNHDRDNELPTCKCSKCVAILTRFMGLWRSAFTTK